MGNECHYSVDQKKRKACVEGVDYDLQRVVKLQPQQDEEKVSIGGKRDILPVIGGRPRGKKEVSQ